MNYFSVGNNEPNKPIGKTITCERCGKRHTVLYGNRRTDSGEWVPDRKLAYVKCRGKTYLAGIDGKRVGF